MLTEQIAGTHLTRAFLVLDRMNLTSAPVLVLGHHAIDTSSLHIIFLGVFYCVSLFLFYFLFLK